MIKRRISRFLQGFGLVEILVVLVLLVLFYHFVMKPHSRPAAVTNKETQRQLGEQGINTASYQTVVSSVETKLDKLQEKLTARRDQEQEIE